MAQFETSVTLPLTCAQLFDFLIRPTNILQIAPPEAALKFIEAPDVLELGSRIEFEVTAVGPAQRLVHEITDFDAVAAFTESQVSGPLKLFRHEHIFEAGPNGNVRMIDRIEFEPPGGLAGFLITEQWLEKNLATGFEHRHRELQRLFPG